MTLQKNFAGNPETWLCVDCGINTAPGHPTSRELELAYNRATVLDAITGEEHPLATLHYNDRCEIYMVRDSVWKAAAMKDWGGCLCIGCLEKRLGRTLNRKDFGDHPFNSLPGTPRLLDRRERRPDATKRRHDNHSSREG